MPADPPVPKPPGAQLAELMALVRTARGNVQVLRAGKVDPARLSTARGVLLDAMESYAAELDRRGLPMPPGLRDELRLQRGIRNRLNEPRRPTGYALSRRGLLNPGSQRRPPHPPQQPPTRGEPT